MSDKVEAVRNAAANLVKVAKHFHTPLDTSTFERALDDLLADHKAEPVDPPKEDDKPLDPPRPNGARLPFVAPGKDDDKK